MGCDLSMQAIRVVGADGEAHYHDPAAVRLYVVLGRTDSLQKAAKAAAAVRDDDGVSLRELLGLLAGDESLDRHHAQDRTHGDVHLGLGNLDLRGVLDFGLARMEGPLRRAQDEWVEACGRLLSPAPPVHESVEHRFLFL